MSQGNLSILPFRVISYCEWFSQTFLLLAKIVYNLSFKVALRKLWAYFSSRVINKSFKGNGKYVKYGVASRAAFSQHTSVSWLLPAAGRVTLVVADLLWPGVLYQQTPDRYLWNVSKWVYGNIHMVWLGERGGVVFNNASHRDSSSEKFCKHRSHSASDQQQSHIWAAVGCRLTGL